MKGSLYALFALALAGTLLSSAAQAEIIKAGNPILEKKGSRVFIPQTNVGSGILGDLLTGRQRAGYQVETVRLAPGASSDGYVAMELNFGALTQFITSGASTLEITFNDMDFVPQVIGSARLTEWVGLSFMPTAGSPIDPEQTPDLILNESNYGLYRPDGFGATNKETVTYSIPVADLKADFSKMNADQELSLVLTFYSDLTRFRNGPSQFRNTPETFNVQLVYEPSKTNPDVPEPLTLAMLVLGATWVVRRRR